jgi:hypothetical protein
MTYLFSILAIVALPLLLRNDRDVWTFIDPAYGLREVDTDRFARTWYGETLTFRLARPPDGRAQTDGPQNQ